MPKNAALDLILFGATGFTGSITAKYICKSAPTNLKWAIAARSHSKLDAKLQELSKEFPDRSVPETIVATLDEESAVKLASSCKVVITTVGPYCRYGSGLVKACAEAGTHYVDCTGEHPWVLDMVEKYHETAKKNGAIIVPQCAFESAPADLTSYEISKLIREKYNTGTKDVTFSLHSLNGGASGGTMETFFSIIELYSLSQLAKASNPLALSPISRPYAAPSRLPVFTHPTLGTLAPWVQATPDRAIVLRSWGLTKQYTPDKSWGDNFSFTEYKRVKNTLEGVVLWLTIGLLSISVILPPFRWLARKVITQPGSGPAQNFDKSKQKQLEWWSVGVVDSEDEGKKGKEVLSSFRYDEGDAYALTALMIVEAGLTILDMEKSGTDCLAKKIGGGVLTPVCLGEDYIDRLKNVGVKIVTKEI